MGECLNNALWILCHLIHPSADESKQKHLKTTFSEFQGSRKPFGRSQKAHRAIMASYWYDALMVSKKELTVYLSETKWNRLLNLDPPELDPHLVNIPVSSNYRALVIFGRILVSNTEKAKLYSKSDQIKCTMYNQCV